MSRLLIWPLSYDLKIVLSCKSADLSTITCCDMLDIDLYHQDTLYSLQNDIAGCLLAQFKISLQLLITGEKMTADFAEVLLFSRDQFDQVLVEIRSAQTLLSYSVVSIEIMTSLLTQLDLLLVVMEENENEKKDRGTGCCG